MTAVAHAVGVPGDAGVIEGPDLPDDKAGLAQAAEQNTIFCRITPEQKKALVGALADRGRFTAMIGDGVNDVPALKQARLAVAMGSGSQITKGIADIVLLRDQFSMLPRAVAEGRRIARNIHRLGRLYVTKTVYAGFLILFAAIFGFAFPFLPRQLTVAAHADDRDPVLRPRPGAERGAALPRPAAARAGRLRGARRDSGSPSARCSRFFMVDKVFGGSLEEGRTAATTTLIVLGLCFILLLERGPGREHITIQSYMLALVAGLGALYALVLAAGAGARVLRPRAALGRPVVPVPALGRGRAGAGGVAWRLPYIQALEAPGRGAAGRRPGARGRRPPRRTIRPPRRAGPRPGRRPDRDGGRAHRRAATSAASAAGARRSSPRSARPRARSRRWRS